MIVNGSETEPASAKDRLLLSRLPHLVLDGAVLAAGAVGSRRVIVKVGENAVDAVAALEAAIAVREREPVSIEVVTGPEGYVAGEESAVVHYLNGGRELPTFVPPRPFERGYRGRPTLIQNPETLAQLALVARFGSRWYRELGTVADPGSALVTITGAVRAPGVYELAFGTAMSDLLEAAGGPSEPLQALLVGGYFGTWMEASQATSLRLAREDLRSVGCTLGSGVLIALGESSCGLHESARVIAYLAGQSAGQCGPCVYGLRAIADAVGALADGVAHPSERDRVLRWTSEVRGRGACHHPDGAVRFVESALAVFDDDIDDHRGGRCTRDPGRASARRARRSPGAGCDEPPAPRQPDHVRGPRAVRGAPARADPARRLGLSDPRRVRGAARPPRPGPPGGRRLPDAGAAARRRRALADFPRRSRLGLPAVAVAAPSRNRGSPRTLPA